MSIGVINVARVFGQRPALAYLAATRLESGEAGDAEKVAGNIRDRLALRDPPGHAVDDLVGQILRCIAPLPLEELHQPRPQAVVQVRGVGAVRRETDEEPIEQLRPEVT